MVYRYIEFPKGDVRYERKVFSLDTGDRVYKVVGAGRAFKKSKWLMYSGSRVIIRNETNNKYVYTFRG